MKFSLLLPRETEDVRELHLKKKKNIYVYIYRYLQRHIHNLRKDKKRQKTRQAIEDSYGISFMKGSILLGIYQKKARLGVFVTQSCPTLRPHGM